MMLFRRMNAPAMFQHIATELFSDLDFGKVYIDDVVIYSNSLAEHTIHITVVYKCTRWTDLKLEIEKLLV